MGLRTGPPPNTLGQLPSSIKQEAVRDPCVLKGLEQGGGQWQVDGGTPGLSLAQGKQTEQDLEVAEQGCMWACA